MPETPRLPLSFLVVLGLMATPLTRAQTPTTPQPPASAAAPAAAAATPCTGDEYRQFDFWLGEWDVASAAAPAGAPPSSNRLTAIDGGCALLEQYSTPSGYTGTSISYYSQADGQWHQTWIDNQGQPVVQSGGLADGAMVMRDSPGSSSYSRTTWTPLAGGKVRQLWQQTSDGGKTWSVVFDGIYSRRAAAAGAP